MPRFFTDHKPTALTKFVLPSGGGLTFVRGVMDTDDEGAAVMRRNPLFGSLIREVDDSAPALEMPPGLPERPTPRPAGPRPDPRGIAVVKVPCVLCSRLFVPRSLGGGQRYCGHVCRRRAASEQERANRPKARPNVAETRPKPPFHREGTRPLAPGGRVQLSAAVMPDNPALEQSSAALDPRTPSMTDASEGTSMAVDRPARAWKPLQVRLSVGTYTWLWRFALLQRKYPVEIVEQALRWFARKTQRGSTTVQCAIWALPLTADDLRPLLHCRVRSGTIRSRRTRERVRMVRGRNDHCRG